MPDVNHLKTQEILSYHFIKQAIVLEYSNDIFCIVSFVHATQSPLQLELIQKTIPNCELIVLDVLPLDTDGNVDVGSIVQQVNLIKSQAVHDIISNTAKEIGSFQLTRAYTQKQRVIPSHQDNAMLKKKTNHAVTKTCQLAYSAGLASQQHKNDVLDLVSALLATVAKYPHKTITTIQSDSHQHTFTYQDLWQCAEKVAFYLTSKQLNTSKAVILTFDEYDVFFASLWGVLFARMAFISITLPNKCHTISAASEKYHKTWVLLDKPIILTTKKKENAFKQLQALYPETQFQLLYYEDILSLSETIPPLNLMAIDPHSTVFYQLTSGSTGTPKCIIETHANIMAHVRDASTHNGYTHEDVSLNWIALDHVVPIITFHFRDVILGCDQIHVATSLIINQPIKWLELIEHYQVTLTWAPHFGYKLLVDAIEASNQLLPSIPQLRYFMNAGEQVTAPVLRRFANILKRIHLSPKMIQPAFGMAETATCMTYNNAFSENKSILKLKSDAFDTTLEFSHDDEPYLEFVDLGEPIPNCNIRIVNSDNQILPELTIGMLQINGPTLSAGYYQNTSANIAFQNDGWLSTGDLGFIYQSRLFITGREKETIIIRGQNFFCYEIEETVEAVDGVKNTFVAATSYYSVEQGTEELLIFYVLDEQSNTMLTKIDSRIKQIIYDGFGIQVKHLIELPLYAFPKTSSGKIQRTQLKNQFLNGEFDWKIEARTSVSQSLHCHTVSWVQKNIHITDIASPHKARIVQLASNPSLDENNEAFPILIVTDLYNTSIQLGEAEYVLRLTHFFQGISTLDHPPEHIIILTKACIKTSHDFINTGYQQGWIYGFVNSIKKEISLPNIVLIDLQGDSEDSDLNLVHQEIDAGLKDNTVAYRQTRRYIPTWYEASLTNLPKQCEPTFTQEGFCLVIGGMGGIGSLLAQHLIKSYGSHLILTSTRSEHAITLREKFDATTLKHITHIQLDLSRATPDFSALVPYQEKIHSIIFLAGISQHVPMHQLTIENIHQHFSPKSKGLVDIWHYFHSQQLQPQYLVFSSIMAVVGTAQFALYAASNSLCDSVCDFLSSQSNVSIRRISWCPWIATGMAKNFDYEKLATLSGFQALQPPLALAYFDRLVQSTLNYTYIGLNAKMLRLFTPTIADEYFIINPLTRQKELPARLIAKLNNLEILDNENKPIKILCQTKTKKRPTKTNFNNLPSVYLEEIWCRRLRIDSFDKTKHFFELGGDSLTAIHILMDIEDVFNVQLTIHSLLSSQHFNALVQRIEHHQIQPIVQPKKKEASLLFPLSSDQQRIWYLTTQGKNSAYNVYKLYQISGPLNRNALQQAIQDILHHYPILKTRIVEKENSLYQEVYPYQIGQIFHYQLKKTTEDVEKAIQQMIESPFSLKDNSPLANITLFSTDDVNHHFILFNFHHLICDEWTIKLLIKQLSTCYNARINDEAPILKPEKINFYQFALQQNKNTYKPTKPFLKQIVNDYVASLPYQQLDNATSKPCSLMLRPLDKGLFLKLQTLAKQQKVSPAILLHSLFSIVLHLYTNQSEINIGIPITYRDNPGLRNSFGFFINTSVIGSRLHSNGFIHEHIQHIKKNYLLAQLNRQVPFSTLLKHYQSLSRMEQHNPLFQVMFVYEDFQNVFSMQGLSVSETMIHNHTAKFHLNLMIKFPKEFEPVLAAEFFPDLIHHHTTKSILEKMSDIIVAYISDPYGSIQSLSQLPSSEQTIINAINPPNEPVLAKTLYNIASRLSPTFQISSDFATLSHATISQKISYYAALIRSHRHQNADIIAIYLSEKQDQVIAILSIASLGLTYLPLNYDDPIERISQIISRSTKINVLTDCKSLCDIGAIAKKVILFSPCANSLSNTTIVVKEPVFESIAYIIFTSGSTGQPKGVMIQHRSVFNTLWDMINRFKLKREDVFLMLSKISFDLSVFDLFASAFLGAQLVVPNDKKVFSPSYILALLHRHQVTIWNSTPGFMRICIDFIKSNHIAVPHPSSLRLILLSGDWIPIDLAVDIQTYFPNAQFVALGGATEASIWSNYYNVETLCNAWSSIPYGRALCNQSLYVLNQLLDFCPINVAGKLYIGGLGVAKGYYKNSALTTSKFIHHPQFGRIYDTGDIAKVSTEGQVIILGRSDDQIKIRGFRVEIKEIEQVILQSGLATQTKVLAIGPRLQKRLAGFLVGSTEAQEIKLNTYLKQHLSAYMIPFCWIHLDHFPLTRNGKIDTQALIEQCHTYQDSQASEEESTDETIDMIKNIFKSVLHIKGIIHHNDSFFALGGDSITASYTVFKINQQLKCHIQVEDLFNYPTPGQLKTQILTTSQTDSSVPIPIRHGLTHSPLANHQLRLIFIAHQNQNAASAYNMTLFYKLHGELNKELFLQACQEVLYRHKILNVHIKDNENGEFIQWYTHHDIKSCHDYFDLAALALDTSAKTDLAKQILINASRTVFELEKDKKYHLHIVQVEKDIYYLLLKLHHVVADGESIKLLFSDIQQRYHHLNCSPVVENRLDYFDYISWFNEFIGTTAYARQLAYWQEKLIELSQLQKNYPSYALPQSQIPSFIGKRVLLSIPKAHYNGIRQNIVAQSSSMFIYLLTLFQWVLHQLFHHHLSVIGTTVASRPDGFENCIGFFANTLPIVTLIGCDDSFETLHQKVRQNVLEMLNNQFVPFEKIVNLTRNIEIKSPKHQPIFQIAFVYLQELYILNNSPKLHVERLYLDNETSKFDLTLYVHEAQEKLLFELEYNTAVFSTEIIQQLIQQIQKEIQFAPLESIRE